MSRANGFVRRPDNCRPGRRVYDYDKIVATARNGKAVRVKIRTTHSNVVTTIGQWLKRHGYQLRMHDTRDGHVTVWAEKRK